MLDKLTAGNCIRNFDTYIFIRIRKKNTTF